MLEPGTLDIAPGQQLAHYRLVEKLGEGGMGLVWRATDTKLDREVAIKILPAEFAKDDERRMRFEREAKLLASLNQPNIAAIYGLEEAEGVHFLVMELVPGEDLAERLARGPLSVDETLEIARQIALALESAHDNGVIHRDLKPANVRLTPDGGVKVLDFGLAKAFGAGAISGDPALSPTMTSVPVPGGTTAAGMILGTAGYMSPEQARGKQVDKRTDIWSFGCVVFECLTGESPFAGETISDILASLLKTEPSWASLPGQTPARLRDLLERCLAKDVRERLRDVGDVRLEIERAQTAGPDAPSVAAMASSTSTGRPSPILAIGLVLLGAVVGIGLWVVLSPRDVPAARTTRLSLMVPDGQLLEHATVAPDGRTLAYVSLDEADGRTRLFLRPLDRAEPTLVEEAHAPRWAVFSPDGQWIAWIGAQSEDASRRQLYKMPVDGSAPPSVLGEPGRWWSVVWPSDENLVAVTSRPQQVLWIAADGSGVSEPIDIAEGQVPGNVIPRAVLPGGTRALCNLVEFREGSWLNHVALLDLETGDASVLMEDGALPVYANTGHILFTRYDRLLAVPFDPDRLELTGGPVAITDGLRTDDTYSGAWFKFSADGTLIHRPGGITGGNRRLVYVHPDGELEDWSDERREITEGPQVSPDGRLAAVTGIGAGALDEVLVASTGQRQLRRLVAESGKDCDPALFAPDGQRIVYRCSDSSRYWIYIRRVDGSGGAELLLEDPIDKGWAVPRRFSADGSRVLFRMSDGMYWVELEPGADGQRDRELFLADTSGWLSPDGRWFAYHSSASGRFELYLRQVSEDGDVGPEVPLTSVGLDDYVWSPTVSNGTVELFVETDDGSMQSVRIAPDASPGNLRFEPLAGALVASLKKVLNPTPLPDGRWLAIRYGEEETPMRELSVVLGFDEEIRRKTD